MDAPPIIDPEAEVEKTVTKDRKTGLVTTVLHSSAGEQFDLELKTKTTYGKEGRVVTRAGLVQKHDVAC